MNTLRASVAAALVFVAPQRVAPAMISELAILTSCREQTQSLAKPILGRRE